MPGHRHDPYADRSASRRMRPLRKNRWVTFALVATATFALAAVPKHAFAGSNPIPPLPNAQDSPVPDEVAVYVQLHPDQASIVAQNAAPPVFYTSCGTGAGCYPTYSCPQRPSPSNCDGYNPGYEGCNGSNNQSLYAGPTPGGTGWVDNRWSSRCLSNWARARTTGSQPVHLDSYAWYGNNSLEYDDHETSHQAWTAMLYSPGNPYPYPCVYVYGAVTSGNGWTPNSNCY
jgi:hypothetical protein